MALAKEYRTYVDNGLPDVPSENLSSVIKKHGKSAVAAAFSIVKKYKPKGLIARYREAVRERREAQSFFERCMSKNCGKEWSEWPEAIRVKTAATQTVGLRRFHREKRYEAVREKLKAYDVCGARHCGQRLHVMEKADKREFLLSMFIFGILIPLGVISAVVLGASVADLLRPLPKSPPA